MTAHLTTDPTATATAVFPTAPGWDALSAALTAEVPVIADRDDLLVTIAPGAGHGAPACFLHAHATIEIDGTHLGTVDPATATPHLIGDRARYATAWGLLTHECAHAHHSRWTPPDDADPHAVAAAMLLEEARIETAHLRRRPDDRYWLRASATNLILADTAVDPTHAPAMIRHDAATAAALLLARTDGGILTPAETAPVAHTVDTVLGADTVAALREVWREALTTADDDTTAMLEIGRRWCEIIGTPPDPTEPEPEAASDPSAPPSGEPSPLAASISATLGRVAHAVASDTPPTDPADAKAAAAKAAAKATKKAAAAARRVFGGGPDSHRPDDGPDGEWTTLAGTRPPTAEERAAARVLGRALSTAGIRDRVAVKTTSALPPGRLRMRGVLAREAQIGAGAIPTARPFTRTARLAVPAPPLRIGIACDVSGSMSAYAAPVASTAWILAHAARHTTAPTTTATVIFGRHVRAITHPGAAPAVVTEFDSLDLWENIPTAIDALDGALGLARPGAARLLVIISDGGYNAVTRRDGQRRLDRLRAAGCAVLWLATHHSNTPLVGATTQILTDPTATARVIGHAATKALRATH